MLGVRKETLKRQLELLRQECEGLELGSIDEYVDGWTMDPAVNRLYRLHAERGTEVVVPAPGYL